MTSGEVCRALVSRVIERVGRLDVLCSNTGIYPQATLDVMTENQWDRMQDVNLKSTFLVVQAALEPMRRQSYGRIVITSSITGPVTGFPGWAHYSASKAGQQRGVGGRPRQDHGQRRDAGQHLHRGAPGAGRGLPT